MAIASRYQRQRRVTRGAWKSRFTKQRINYRGTTKPTTPVLSSISPTTGVAGAPNQIVTCTGTGFVSGITKVTVGSLDLPTTFVSATSVTFVMPLPTLVAGTQTVNVRNGTLFSTTPKTYTVSTPTAVTLTSISPTTGVHGAANQTVTCTGTGYVTGVTEATVDGVAQPTTFVSATSVTFPMPLPGMAAGTVSVNVRNGAQVGAAKTYTVT